MENIITGEFAENKSEEVLVQLTAIEEFYREVALDELKNFTFINGMFVSVSQFLILSTMIVLSIYIEDNLFSRISPEFYLELSSLATAAGAVTTSSLQSLLIAMKKGEMRTFAYPEELKKFTNLLIEAKRLNIPIPEPKHSAKPLVELGRLIHSRRNKI